MPSNERLMLDEISDQLERIASKYGYSLPCPNFSIQNDLLIIGNISLYKGDYKNLLRLAYIELSKNDSLGINPSWIDSEFLLEESGLHARIIGLDIEHPTHCLRVEDELGKQYLITPQRARELIENEV